MASLFLIATLLNGCSSSRPLADIATPSQALNLSGSIRGGQQPISGATVQLYAMGTTGAVSTPLLTKSVSSDSTGLFSITESFLCPSTSAEVYLISTGGNPGLSSSTTNPSIVLMAAVGPCGKLTSSTPLEINEVTTVGSLWPLAPYIKSASAIGSSDNAQLVSALSIVTQLVDTRTASAPGPDLPVGSAAPVSKINTIANLLATCVNSSGGTAGDGSSCGRLFAATTPPSGTAPADTLSAALQIARNPTLNVETLYDLAQGNLPFQPQLTSVPADWTLPILATPAAPQISPNGATFYPETTATLSDITTGAAIYYTLDGSTPNAASTLYTGPITLRTSLTLKAVAIVNGLTSSIATSSFTLSTSHLTFLTQPSAAPAGAPISPAPQLAIEDAAGNVLTGANGYVTLALTGGSAGATLSGTTTANFISGIASFSNLSISTPGSGYALVASSSDLIPVTSSAFSIALPSISLTPSSTPLTLGHTVTATLSLSKPAPAGGLVVTLSSSDTTLTTVSLSTITVPAGSSSGSFNYTSLTPGTVSLTATGSGFSTASLSVSSAVSLVSSKYFGMTVLQPTIEQLNLPFTYGTTRVWDVYPEVDWSDSNPSSGVYDFTALDNYMATNDSGSKAEIVYTFGRTPQWASSQPNAPGYNGPGSCAPPANLQDWDNYLTAIATHTLGKIHIWEIWNEPQDIDYYCGDMPTMIALTQHAQRILKAIDPSAIVLSPAPTGGYGPGWMSSFLAAGGGDSVDVISFHGYWSGNAEELVPVIAQYRALMKTNNIATKPFWDSEGSWEGENPPTDPADQAAFLTKYYFLQWSLGIDRFIWYAYDGLRWGGLWDSVNGIHPAGTAFAQTYNWMVGADMTNACKASPSGTWTCDLSRSGGYRARVVWNSTANVQYTPDPSYTQFRDLTNAVTPIKGSPITVGNQPILLETGTSPYPL